MQQTKGKINFLRRAVHQFSITLGIPIPFLSWHYK